MNPIRKGLAVAVIVLFVSICVIPSTGINVEKVSKTSYDGNTLYVGGDGLGNYTKIQDAIDNASDGDTVFVYNDSSPYYENLIVNASINLIGANRDNTIIYGNGFTDVITFYAGKITISGFTIKNSGWDNCGIYINSSSNNNTIMFNGISDNHDSMYLEFSSNNYIIDNIIDDNNYGIGCSNSNDNIFLDNYIFRSTYAISISKSSGNIIQNNDIIDCGYGGIRVFYSSHNNSIINNTINMKYYYGLLLSKTSMNNTVIRNSFYHTGLSVYNTFENTIKENLVNNKDLVYLYNVSDQVINENSGQVILVRCNNITVRNQNLSDAGNGLVLLNSDNCQIIGNNLNFNNNKGIRVEWSNNNTITGNTISSNFYGNLEMYRSNNNTVSNNSIFDRSISYRSILLERCEKTVISSNYLDLSCIYIEWFCNEINITSNIIKNNAGPGISFQTWSENCFVSKNIITESEVGIEIQYLDLEGYAKNITITGNNISNNQIGISVGEYCPNNLIIGNIISNNSWGIITYGRNNRFSYNNFIKNDAYETKTTGIWTNNYYSDWIGLKFKILSFLPYKIKNGRLLFGWDWHPAQEPYDIGV